jgi:beta-lactamase superfamily II metal-dependent hydrolase
VSKLSEKLAAIRRQHNTAGDWEMTLELLRALKAGEVQLDHVILTDGGWNVVEPAPELKLAEPTEPAAETPPAAQ